MVDRSRLTASITSVIGVNSPQLHEASDLLAVPDNFIGIEMEVENAPRLRGPSLDGIRPASSQTPRGWTRVEDHSLRNNGAEYITTNPITGDEVVSALSRFETWAAANNVQSSFRTSTHVHVDFSQKRDTMFVIQDFLMGYYLLEEAFYAFRSVDRAHSGYCYPFSMADTELLRLLRAKAASDMAPILTSMQRYYGCNPASLAKHGTIEFRHLPLVVEAADVIRWINMILRLKKFVLENCTPKLNILEVIDYKGHAAFASEVLGTEYRRLIGSIDFKVIKKRMAMLSAVYSETAPTRRASTGFGVKNPLYAKFMGGASAKKAAKKPVALDIDESSTVRMEVGTAATIPPTAPSQWNSLTSSSEEFEQITIPSTLINSMLPRATFGLGTAATESSREQQMREYQRLVDQHRAYQRLREPVPPAPLPSGWSRDSRLAVTDFEANNTVPRAADDSDSPEF